MSNIDDFADIIYSDRQVGVFGSTEAALDNGFQEFISVATAALPDGIAFEFRCEGCSAHPRLVIEYAEAVAMKNGLDPAKAFAPNVPLLTPQGPQGSARQICGTPSSWSWRRNEGAWGLNQKCSCDWHFTVRLKPNELNQLLSKAAAEGYLGQRENVANVHCQMLVRQQPRR